MLAGLQVFKKTFFVLFLILASFLCEAKIAFWQPRASSLAFITTAQTFYNFNCSSVVTIENRNSQNLAANVASNVTLNLSSTDSIQFFSDRACSTPISSVTMTSGTSRASFYFLTTQTGSLNFKVNATSYSEIAQNATLSSNPFVWTNNFGNGFWGTASNWSGGTVPGSSDVAIFTNQCGANCDISLNSAVNVKGIRIFNNYLASINQATAVTVAVGSSGWIQESGTFFGGNANITIANNFILNNATFNASTATTKLTYSGADTSVISKFQTNTSFNANNGTFELHPSCSGDSLDFNASTFNSLIFNGHCGSINLNSRTMTVLNDMTFITSSYSTSFNNATFEINGNININRLNPGTFLGSFILRLKGNASGQTIFGHNLVRLPNIEIDSPNDVTINGYLNVYSFKVLNVQNLITTGSTINFNSRCASDTAVLGNLTYNNIIIGGQCLNLTFDGGSPTVLGNLTLSGDQYGTTISNANFQIFGNISSIGNYLIGGSATYTLKGNVSGQTISQTNLASNFANLRIDSGANNVEFLTPVQLTKILLLQVMEVLILTIMILPSEVNVLQPII